MTSVAVEQLDEQFKAIETNTKALLKKGLYADALTLSTQHWGPIDSWRLIEQRKIASTIYAHLGGYRNSEAISLRLFRQFPDKPELLKDYWYYVLNKDGSILAKEFFDQSKTKITDPKDDDDVIGFDAVLQRLFHNYEQSEQLIEKGRQVTDNKAWFEILHISNLIAQDEFELAFSCAQTLYEAEPKISTLRAYFNSAQHAKGLEFATDIYGQELTKFQSASMWLDCATSYAELLNWPQCERALNEYNTLKIAEDRQSKRNYLILHGQCLLARGEIKQGQAVLRQSKQYYWQAVCRNIDKYNDAVLNGNVGHDIKINERPNTGKKILDVPFYRQKHLTCAPTTMAAIASFLGKQYDSELIAAEICFDGTPDTKERQWLRDHEFSFAEFELTEQLLVELINKNIPFALVTTSGFSSHMQAVIGYNLPHGSMYIMDPSSPAMQEMLIQETIEKESFLGARCMAFVPKEQGHSLDFIDTICRHIFPIQDQYQLARQDQDADRMTSVFEQMKSVAPEHRLTLIMERDLACFFNDTKQIQGANNKLLALAPNETVLLNSQYFCMRDLGDRKGALKWLSDYLENNTNLDLSETLFNELSDTSENPELVEKLLLKLKTIGCRSASVYYSIGNYYWATQEFVKAKEYYFISHCMNDTNAVYVENFFKMANILGESEHALSWLNKRVEKYQERSASPAISLYHAYCIVNQKANGIAVLKNALSLHPKDSELVSTLSFALADVGEIEALQALITSKKDVLSERLRVKLTARLNELQGLMEQACDCYYQLYSDAPFITDIANLYFQSLTKFGATEKLNNELQTLIEQHPKISTVYIHAANWHNDPQFLVENLATGLALRPDNWFLHQTLINAYLQLNQYPEALKQAQEAYQRHNRGPFQTAYLAKCYYYCNDFEQATQLAKQVLNIDVDNSTALWLITATGSGNEDKQQSLSYVKQLLIEQHSIDSGIWHYWYEGRHILPESELQNYVDMLLSRYHNNWSSYCIAAQFYSQFHKMDKAIELLNIGQEKFPLIPRMYSEQADIELAIGDISAAIESTKKALKINPSWDTVAKKQSELYEKQGNLIQAKQTIADCLTHNSLDGILHGFYADYALKLNNKEEALKHLKQAIRFNIDYPWGWEQLQEITTELGVPEQALELADELTTNQPHLAPTWRFKAYLADDRQTKKQCFEKAIICDPMDESSYAQLSQLYTRQGEFTAAIDLLNSTPWGEQLPVELATAKAELLSQTGRDDEAATVLYQLLFNQSGLIQAWQKLYGIFSRLIDHDNKYKLQAVEAAQRHITLNPHDPDVLCVAGEQLLAYGDKQEATECLKRAYELSPSDEYIMLTYVDRLVELAQFEAALTCLIDYEKVSLVNFALARKVNVLTQLQKIDEALDAFTLLISNQCDIYGTLHHAYKSLNTHVAAEKLVELLSQQLENCSRMQASLWADKFLLLHKRKPVNKLLAQIDTIQSQQSWAGAFSSVLDYLHDKSEIPADDMISNNKSRLHQDEQLVMRLTDVYIQAGHYYNVIHLFDGIDDLSKLPMAGFYNYAVCLLMLNRGQDASLIIHQGLQVDADHTLHNLLVWGHADNWIQTHKISPEELNLIDQRELIQTEQYIFNALNLMSRLELNKHNRSLPNIKAELSDLRNSYNQVAGMTVCDVFHRKCKAAIKTLVAPQGVWQNLQLAWIIR